MIDENTPDSSNIVFPDSNSSSPINMSMVNIFGPSLPSLSIPDVPADVSNDAIGNSNITTSDPIIDSFLPIQDNNAGGVSNVSIETTTKTFMVEDIKDLSDDEFNVLISPVEVIDERGPNNISSYGIDNATLNNSSAIYSIPIIGVINTFSFMLASNIDDLINVPIEGIINITSVINDGEGDLNNIPFDGIIEITSLVPDINDVDKKNIPFIGIINITSSSLNNTSNDLYNIPMMGFIKTTPSLSNIGVGDKNISIAGVINITSEMSTTLIGNQNNSTAETNLGNFSNIPSDSLADNELTKMPNLSSEQSTEPTTQKISKISTELFEIEFQLSVPTPLEQPDALLEEIKTQGGFNSSNGLTEEIILEESHSATSTNTTELR